MTTQDTKRRGTARRATPETGRIRVGSSVLTEGRPDRMQTTTRDRERLRAPAEGQVPRGNGPLRGDPRRADAGRADAGRADAGRADARRADARRADARRADARRA